MTGLDKPIFAVAALLSVATFTLGGSGRDNSIAIMAMVLIGLVLLTMTVWSRSVLRPAPIAPFKLALLGALLLIPLLQLIPLPPEVWTSLPGRAEAAETLRLAQAGIGWAPLSLTPEVTFRSFLWLAPAAALFLAVDGMDVRRRYWLVGLVLGLTVASLVLGGLQIADSDGGMFRLRQTAHLALPTGFFVNRNHQALALVVALPLAAAFAAVWGNQSAERRRPASLIYLGLVGLLLVGVLVTRSRAGLTLMGPALITSIAIFWTARGARRLRREVLAAVAVGAVALIVAAQFAIGAVLDRFQDFADSESRFKVWPSIISSGVEAAPVGTGLGSFEAWYQAREPLEFVGPQFVNHAHNDYLELWLETGILFPLVFIAFLAWVGLNTLRAWRAPTTQGTVLARAASAVILLLLAHSIADYPLRTQALACVFAVAAACLASGPGRDLRLSR